MQPFSKRWSTRSMMPSIIVTRAPTVKKFRAEVLTTESATCFNYSMHRLVVLLKRCRLPCSKSKIKSATKRSGWLTRSPTRSKLPSASRRWRINISKSSTTSIRDGATPLASSTTTVSKPPATTWWSSLTAAAPTRRKSSLTTRSYWRFWEFRWRSCESGGFYDLVIVI